MTVSELRAILNTLPDDIGVLINHERFRLHPPELFVAGGSDEYAAYLMIVPTETATFRDAMEQTHWRHITLPSE